MRSGSCGAGLRSKHPVPHAARVADGGARCVGVAVCDDAGVETHTEVPAARLVIQNDKWKSNDVDVAAQPAHEVDRDGRSRRQRSGRDRR